jgi:hypothetical protein
MFYVKNGLLFLVNFSFLFSLNQIYSIPKYQFLTIFFSRLSLEFPVSELYVLFPLSAYCVSWGLTIQGVIEPIEVNKILMWRLGAADLRALRVTVN